MSSPSHQRVNLWLVGILALASLAAGIIMALNGQTENIWCASFIRLGLLLSAFWIAMPRRGRAAAWANISPFWVAGAIGVLLVLIRRPIVLVPVAIALFVLAVVVPLFTTPRPRR